MTTNQNWSTVQPNFSRRHLRSASDLVEGMNIIIHQRIGSMNHTVQAHIEVLDRDAGQIKLCETNEWLELCDFGVIPTTKFGTTVWSRFNWLERA